MGFTDYIYATIQNLKCSFLQVGLNAFFDNTKVGRSPALSRLFLKVDSGSPKRSGTLFQSVVGKFHEEADPTNWKALSAVWYRWHSVKSPAQPNLCELMENQSQGAPQVQALVSCVYDLLHGIIVDTRFECCTPVNERQRRR